MRLVHSGKVKDIYEVDSRNYLFQFTDRISAFDIPMITPIDGKGEILCKFAEFWFKTLEVKNHMIRTQGKDAMLVKKLEMIPIEFVIRGYLYGSLYDRYRKGMFEYPEWLGHSPILASKLPMPICDPTTKSNIHDRPISESEILHNNIVSSDELSKIRDISIDSYMAMNERANMADLIIADVKFEFGKDPDTGEILLADSIGPDEFRIWSKSCYVPGKIQDSFDKQYLRDWLTQIGFKEKVDRLRESGIKPVPPSLPEEVVKELVNRYAYVYQKISSMCN
jgi:phosphoribosylaminoimidazole-succinocarboxamide synthase